MFDVIIIGGGPAGLTATYELSKNNKKVLLIEKKAMSVDLPKQKFLETSDMILDLTDFLQRTKKLMNYLWKYLEKTQ